MSALAVVIPGIGGSALALDGETVWPGTLREYVRGYAPDRFAKLLDDRVVATDVLRVVHAAGPVYEPLLAGVRALGYAEDPAAPYRLLAFAYDWRRSIAVAARALADRLDAEAAAGRTEIHLIAHSMGGLVARHYLEAPEHAARPARGRVRLLAAIAVPHRGAPSTAPAIMGARRFHYMTRAQVRQLSHDLRYPSAYELLPPPGEPYVWNGDPGGALAPVSPHRDPVAAGALGLAPERLAAAAAVLAELRADWTGNGAVGPQPRYVLFAGAGQLTLDHWLLAGGRPVPVEVAGGGDGRVPFWSAALPGLQRRPVNGSHDDVYEDAAVGATLALLLPRPAGVAAPVAPAPVRVSLRDTVLRPGEPFRLTLIAAGTAGMPAGAVRVTHERAEDDAPGGAPPFDHPVAAATVATLHLELPAPKEFGAWRVAFDPAGGGPADAKALYITAQV